MIPRAPHRRARSEQARQRNQLWLHIDRLVLYGVGPRDAARIAAAMEIELTRLAAEPGQAFAPATTERAAPVVFEAKHGPEQTGRAAAAALWSGVRQSGEGTAR